MQMCYIFRHGGPGSRSYPNDRRLFNPTSYRIILFDQRGAGLSTPAHELRVCFLHIAFITTTSSSHRRKGRELVSNIKKMPRPCMLKQLLISRL